MAFKSSAFLNLFAWLINEFSFASLMNPLANKSCKQLPREMLLPALEEKFAIRSPSDVLIETVDNV